MVTDRQVRKLMEVHEKTGSISRAARKADMDRKTTAKYIKAGAFPVFFQPGMVDVMRKGREPQLRLAACYVCYSLSSR